MEDMAPEAVIFTTPELLLCQAAEDFPSYTCAELARWAESTSNLPVSLNKATASENIRGHTTLQRQPTESDARKKRLQPAHALVDQKVIEFVLQPEKKPSASTDRGVREARNPPPFASSNWPFLAMLHAGFHWRCAYGESSTVDMDKAKDQLDRVRAAIHMYPPRNVFNMGEYALFHNAIPRGPAARAPPPP
ncbi:hypothetical protein PR001_g8587 [Phytophthora rubi]|uniref:Uncharacterized protein n=1 Tax=Phytophthora rubi TaxID=129364 RepID=A0A6A3MV25_9STRA|nr:hypothetical protein PR001_g8587 [Phytophthora rubi]